MLVTWKTIVVNGGLTIHPNTWDYWNNNGEGIFTETAYTDGVGTYVGILDNATIPTTSFNFNVVEKTEAEIQTLLNDWYSFDTEGQPYVQINNGVFIDNREIIV